MSKTPAEFIPLQIALLTVSDHRTLANDDSGDYFARELLAAGHTVHSRLVARADKHALRAVVCNWLVDAAIQVILINGGTGYTDHDCVPEAVVPLLDTPWSGFGELFRQLSYEDIGSSALQSRAFVGFANDALIVCVPGSPNACRLAWEKLLLGQLDRRTRPCSVVPLIRGNHSLCGS